MDGLLEIVESFSNSITEPIINRVAQLQFLDNEKHIIEIDTIIDRPVVINIWATWCHPCVAEISVFNKLTNEYKECDVNFLALSYIEDSTGTNKFLKSHPFYFKQILTNRDYVEKN